MDNKRTKSWLELNGFLDKGQKEIEDSNNNIIKNTYSIKVNPSDPDSKEKAVAFLEDFYYANGRPLLQGEYDRSNDLTAAFIYSANKGYKFFFLSKANKQENNYPWGENVIISFEFSSTKVNTANRFKNCFDDISNYHFEKTKNELKFQMKRYDLKFGYNSAGKSGGNMTVINIDNNNHKNLIGYLSVFDSRAFKNNCHIIRVPVQDVTPEKDALINALPHNLLVYGAPGTGKSHLINEKLKEYKMNIKNKIDELEAKIQSSSTNKEKEEIKDSNELDELVSNYNNDTYYTRVTFYEDYTYEAFVGCYKPMPEEITDTINKEGSINEKWNIKGKRVTYGFVAGPFINILVRALNYPQNEYFIIIEELNRANAASVFGDMLQLIDRKKNGESRYEISPTYELKEYLRKHLRVFNGTIKIPSNLHVWATMNSADQGVFPIDSAFKRRWSFYYMDLNNPWDINISLPEGTYTWESIRNAINEKILDNDGIDEDRCIGSHFFSEEEIEQINNYKSQTKGLKINPFVDKLISYLRMDVFRHNPSFIFKKCEGMSSLSMSEIRKHFDSGKILDIFKIDENKFIKQEIETINKDDNSGAGKEAAIVSAQNSTSSTSNPVTS